MENNLNNDGKVRNNAIALIIFMSALIICVLIGVYVYQESTRGKKETKVKTETKDVKSKYELKGNDISDFDLYFMKLNNKEKNEVYSPLSIKYALEMLAEGAGGNTKKQLDSIIGKYENKKYQNNSNMSFANAMFIRNTFKDGIKENYTNNLKNKYNAEVIYDDFKSANNINNWISKNTFNLLKNVVNDGEVSSKDFMLVNALAIDMNWNYKIQASSTQSNAKDKFYNIDYLHEKFKDYVQFINSEDEYSSLKFNNSKNAKVSTFAASANRYDIVKTLGEDNIRSFITGKYKEWLLTDEGKELNPNGMTDAEINEEVNTYIKELNENYTKNDTSTDFSYYTDDDVKVFAKDLAPSNDVTLQYVGIMPNKVSLSEYIKSMDSKSLSNIIKNLKNADDINSYEDGKVTQINGQVPLFNYEYELDLDNSLKSLGVKDIYDSNKSDFTNMLTDKNRKEVIETIHKANIEFSNEGIKASAATIEGGLGAARGPGFDYEYDVPLVKIDLTFDKPYLYIIRDKATGEVWFAGTVYEPVEK